MSNDWEAYFEHCKEIWDYVKEFREKHGEDGTEAVIENLMLRLARLRAGIDESAVYGE